MQQSQLQVIRVDWKPLACACDTLCLESKVVIVLRIFSFSCLQLPKNGRILLPHPWTKHVAKMRGRSRHPCLRAKVPGPSRSADQGCSTIAPCWRREAARMHEAMQFSSKGSPNAPSFRRHSGRQLQPLRQNSHGSKSIGNVVFAL